MYNVTFHCIFSPNLGQFCLLVFTAGQVGVPVDDTGMQFPNIVEVSSVQDESSDFELPPDMRT